MNAESMIQNYLELYMNKRRIESLLEHEQDIVRSASRGAQKAYESQDFDKEERLDQRVLVATKKVGDLEIELTSATLRLEDSSKVLSNELNRLSSEELQKLLELVKGKKANLECEIQNLDAKERWAIHRGNLAYEKDNYAAEEEYNKIAQDCFNASEAKKAELKFYRLLEPSISLRISQIVKKTLHD